MIKLNSEKMAGAVVLFFAVTAMTSQAQSFRSLVEFNGTDGNNPQQGALVQSRDGNFYGTTYYGGAFSGSGTVFKMGPAGKLTSLYTFCEDGNCVDGRGPWTGLTLGTNGDLYGTTAFGGAYGDDNDGGTVFKITQEGMLTTIYNFCSQSNCTDGEFPAGTLVQATGGDMYGTTVRGGIVTGSSCAPYGCGTVFKISPSGTFGIMHKFCSQEKCADGSAPLGGMIQASDGNFYGTTQAGGTPTCGLNGGCGTVFKLTPGGQLATLHSFGGTDGEEPQAGLVEGTDGNFYGTTSAGEGNEGTIFMITPQGTFTTLYMFIDLSDGIEPHGSLIQATDGNFYGTTWVGGTYEKGTLFKMTPDGTLTTVYNFCPHKGCPDGQNPESTLVQSTRGFFYGAAIGGTDGDGTIFGLNEGLGPFVAFVQSTGRVGQTGGILGQGFTGTTSVSLNGVPANFAVVSDTFIKATVPAGATSGYVTVTTPSGTLTSNVPFHVIR